MLYTFSSMKKGLSRDYGIDIARILAMFLVCVLHVGGCWRGMANAPTMFDRAAAVTYWSLAYVAVDLFMLITGYLGINRTWKIKSYLRLWGQVAFYLMGGFLFAYSLNGACCSWSYFIANIFPIPCANAYWYFTAYSGAFFFFPYLNKVFLALTKHEREKLLLTLFLIICVFGFYNKHVWGGYNAVWMLVMYLAGAYLKLHPIALNTKYLLALYVSLSISGGILFSLDCHLRHTFGFSLPIPGLDYTSPFTVCASIACFVACTRVHMRSYLLQKLLATIAPLTFAVYLIHTHPATIGYFGDFIKSAAEYTHYSWWHIPTIAFLAFVFCIFIEYTRVRIFKSVAFLLKISGNTCARVLFARLNE